MRKLTTFNLKHSKDNYIHLIISTIRHKTFISTGTVQNTPDAESPVSINFNYCLPTNLNKIYHPDAKRITKKREAMYHELAIEEVIREFEQKIDINSRQDY